MPRAAALSLNNEPTVWHHPVKRWLGIVLLVTLAWDASGLDLPVMWQIGTSSGFPLRHHAWLVGVFHEGWRQFFAAFFVSMVVWALWPARWNLPRLAAMNLPRRERWTLILLVLLSLLAVNLVKINSQTSCPWDLQQFGGTARYLSHWALGQSDGGSGRCFPGGHASSAFAFVGLCLPWLAPPPHTARAPAAGLRWLTFLLLAGLTAGTAQTLRGAHFPSHTLWTLLICGSVSWIGWQLALPRLAQRLRVFGRVRATPQNVPDPGAKHSHSKAMARICNAERVRFGVVSGHERKTLSFSCLKPATRAAPERGGLRFPAGPPQGKSTPSGGSDPRSGGAWGQ